MNNHHKKVPSFHKVHMTGIGGIGMSGLAQYLIDHKVAITGSDLESSKMTSFLSQKYATPISIGTHPEILNDEYDALVYSPAVPENDPERKQARALGIPEYSYPKMLGYLTQSMMSITVSGTNGKTTTTSMLVELFHALAQQPTAIVGEVSQVFDSNYISGKGDYFIAEACEYRNSFLNLNWDIAVITNISLDHLDFFSDLADIQKSFGEYLLRRKDKNSILVVNTKQKNIQPIIQQAQEYGIKIIDYAVYLDDDIKVSIPGEHNKENAAAALAVIDTLGLNLEQARLYLEHDFRGAKRRFQFLGKTPSGAFVYDDYAHNPEGLHHLIKSLQTVYPDKRIVLAFEPHLYSRTRDLACNLAEELSRADEVFLFPTYPAREEYRPEESFLLKDMINNTPVTCIDETRELKEYVSDYGDDTVIVTAGAGVCISGQAHTLVKK